MLAIVDDRLFECAAVLVERAEVVGGLTALESWSSAEVYAVCASS